MIAYPEYHTLEFKTTWNILDFLLMLGIISEYERSRMKVYDFVYRHRVK